MKAWLEWPQRRHTKVAAKFGLIAMVGMFLIRGVQTLGGYPEVIFTFGTRTVVYAPILDGVVTFFAVFISWLAIVETGRWFLDKEGGDARIPAAAMVAGILYGTVLGLCVGIYSPPPDSLALSTLIGLIAGLLGGLLASISPVGLSPGLFFGLVLSLTTGLAYGLLRGMVAGLTIYAMGGCVSCIATILIAGITGVVGRIIRNQSWKTFSKRFWGWMTS